ncbi:MAG: helix-turn-helix transcriptional regulator [Alicyclobacillus sp.]|nr:helix-turn-helix transcriptional regulator [Alicyclobacillus sp.]
MNGLRKGWVAAQARITPTSLSQLIGGKRLPSLEVAYRIARVLDTRVDEIWVWEDEAKSGE